MAGLDLVVMGRGDDDDLRARTLAGEIRPVVGGTQRASEARRLGYCGLIDAEAGTLRRARQLAWGEG